MRGPIVCPEQSPTHDFVLDRANQCLWRGAVSVSLTPKAYALLDHLVRSQHVLVTKEELLDTVWAGTVVTDGVLKVTVLELRRALGDDAKKPRYIETVHRRGYRFLVDLPERVGPPGAVEPSREAEPGVLLVGREMALAFLEERFERAASGDRQTILVTGPPGIGKTTLVDAFLRNAETRAQVLRGQCLEQYGASEGYLPLFEAFERAVRGNLRDRVERVLGLHAPTLLFELSRGVDPMVRERLRHAVLGATKERMLREIAEALEALSAERPLVLVIEDLHWCDPSTLDVVMRLATRRERARILVVLTHRPIDVLDTEHPLRTVRHELSLHRLCEELAIGRLARDDVAHYLGSRFPNHAFPVDLATALHRRTEGHPLFIVNVVDWLVSRNDIRDVGGRAHLMGDVEGVATAVPESIRQILEMHFDRLDESDLRTLEAASVAGIDFPAAAVAAALDEDLLQVEERCDALCRRHSFLRSAGVSEFPDRSYSARFAFSHSLYATVLYGRTPEARRLRYHLRIGQRGEELYGARAVEIAAELAVHFEAARDAARSVRFRMIAAENAARRQANREAEAHLVRARDLCRRISDPERSRLDLSLLEELGLVRRSMGDMQGSAEAFASMTAFAVECGTREREVQALLYLASALFWDEPERCLAAVDRAEELATRVPNELLLAHARGYRGHCNLCLRGFDHAHVDACARAVEAARHASDDKLATLHVVRFAYAQILMGDHDGALRSAEEGAELALATAGAFDYLLSRFLRCWALLFRGRFGEMIETLDAAIAMAERNGHSQWVALFRLERAQLESQLFNFESARELAAAAVREARATRASTGQILYHGLIALAEAEVGLGNLDAARAALDELETRLAEHGFMDCLLYLPYHHAAASCAFARGELALARMHSEQLLDRAAACGEPTWRAFALVHLARTAERSGENERAREHSDRAVEIVADGTAPLAEWHVYATAELLAARSGTEPDARFRCAKQASVRRLCESMPAPDHRTLTKRIEAFVPHSSWTHGDVRRSEDASC